MFARQLDTGFAGGVRGLVNDPASGATARTRFTPRWAVERRRPCQVSGLPQRRAQAHRFQPI